MNANSQADHLKRIQAGCYAGTISGVAVRVYSENKYHASFKTEQPRQIWTAQVEGEIVAEGCGTRGQALASAARYISRHSK